MTLYLSPILQKIWNNKDPFYEAEQLQGEVFRELEARRTLRFHIADKSYFAKVHRGVGWFEIIDNLLRLRFPVLGARNEYEAIKRLEHLHIDTMKIVGYGEKGLNPAQQKSFIITEDLINTISLEDYCLSWKNQTPDFQLKLALIKKLAHVSRLLHNNGINHRDYYICHFLLALSRQKNNVTADNLKVSLIDLHRAQLRKNTPMRWRVKDIASLYFSAMDIGLTQRDFFRFIKIYHGDPQYDLRQILQSQRPFWQQVTQQANKLWRRKQRKGDSI